MPSVLLTIPARPDSREDAWLVLRNLEPAHPVDVDLLDQALDLAAQGFWHRHGDQMVQLGSLLYRLLNGTHLLDELQRQAHQRGEVTRLALDVPAALRDLPWEVLHNGKGFVLHRGGLHLVRQVTDRHQYRKREPESRHVQLLFMACSPLNSTPVLDFEKEEEQILRQIESNKLPVDVHVEDSGSLDGLRFAMQEWGNVDVVHLSGHAKATKDGPVFLMESETGATVYASPNMLWEALEDHPPQLLFLSGCETGKVASPETDAATSFARAMVEKGVPMVIGWGLSVLDVGASAFAQHLYVALGKGKDLAEAVFKARSMILQDHHTWPLIRVFCDAAPFQPLANPKTKVVRRNPRKRTYRILQNSQVKVMASGFVGRRRQVQRGLRVLKGEVDETFGLLLTGVAGVGKSTLTGKLVGRYQPDHLLVFHGKVDHGTFLAKLRAHFEKLGDQEALAILDAQADLKDRIKALLREGFTGGKTLMIFDDYEQNLIDETRLMDSQKEIMPALLQGLSWETADLRLIITSRYPFKVEEGGQDWVAVLERMEMMSMRGAELEKLQRSLSEISKRPQQKQRFAEISGGNPRLLEWFNIALEQIPELDTHALETTLQDEAEAYKQKYLADLIAKAEADDFKSFLTKAAVYRIPVPAEAYEKLGTPAMLQRAVDPTLMEKEEDAYWVMPLLREAWFAEATDAKELHKIAYAWHDRDTVNDRGTFADSVECIYHGSAAYQMKGCWFHPKILAHHYHSNCLYREDLGYLKDLWPYVDTDAFAAALEQGDREPVWFLGNMGHLLKQMGALKTAKPYYEEALGTCTRVLGEIHADTATCLNNIGLLLQAMGDLSEAKTHYEKALGVRNHLLGENHPDTAESLNNLGFCLQAMGSLTKAKTYYEKGLRVRKCVLGKNNVAIAYSLNNLGSLLHSMGAFTEAKLYYEEALGIWKQVLVRDHPDIAIYHNNLGMVLKDLGALPEAKLYFEEALDIFRRVLGEDHSQTASSMNSLGGLLWQLGEMSEAKPYLEKALGIRKRVLGENHNDIAESLNILGLLLQDMGALSEAKQYLEEALAIRKRVLDEDHYDTALSLNNLGMLLKAAGALSEAKQYLEEALGIKKRMLGDRHFNTVAIIWNLLLLEWQLEEKASARQRAASLLWLFQADDAQLAADHKTVRDRLNRMLPELFPEGIEAAKAAYEAQQKEHEEDP